MCSYYHQIDLKQLPSSNPFAEENTTPVETTLPNNIVVESPDSQIHTAWTNIRRFPSLYRHPPTKNEYATSSTLSSKPITVLGPRELARQSQLPYEPYRRGQNFSPLDTSVKDARAQPHQLLHQSRINSIPVTVQTSIEHDSSSSEAASGQPSPVSEDEFSYLPSSQSTLVSPIEPQPSLDIARTAIRVEVPIPAPLRIRRAPQSSTEWMDDVCRNF